MNKIGIAGAGAWGLALAAAVRRAGRTPVIWSRRGDFEAADLTVTGDARALSSVDMLLLTVSAQELASVAAHLAPNLAKNLPLVICAKGIVQPENRLLDDVLAEALPHRPIAVLSGPSFAAEVANAMPTAVTIASHDADLAHEIVVALGSASFRPYSSTDPVGVQLGGAIKNVIAIACGIVAGRKAGENARAALITRGLAEMARLGRAMGARNETFAGLTGLGDLSLTATSVSSRNFRLGVSLGGDRTLTEALAGISGVVEGVSTAPAVVALAAKNGVEMPISSAVAAIIGQSSGIAETMNALLTRPFKNETA
jgi:glycerol-3-phosphate dehydrogenase (NAD(P)+)